MLNCPQFIAISWILLNKTNSHSYCKCYFSCWLKEISKLSFITVKCHVNACYRTDGSLSPTVNISTSIPRQLITIYYTWKVKYKFLICAVKLPLYGRLYSFRVWSVTARLQNRERPLFLIDSIILHWLSKSNSQLCYVWCKMFV